MTLEVLTLKTEKGMVRCWVVSCSVSKGRGAGRYIADKRRIDKQRPPASGHKMQNAAAFKAKEVQPVQGHRSEIR